AGEIETAFKFLAHSLQASGPVAAVSIACFMHSFLGVDARGAAATPVYTWLDTTDAEGLSRVRARLGHAFHERTGCHYHPMFPVFKIPSTGPWDGRRVKSPKSMLVEALTGSFVEDYGMAGASGLLNVHSAEWDEDILQAVGITRHQLPALLNPHEIVGRVTA